MCNQSFSATADSLAELIQIVALHLEQAEDPDYEPHMVFRANLEKQTGEKAEQKREMEMLLANYSTDPSEIVRSTFFSWDILRLVPYTKILEIPPPPSETSKPADEKNKREEPPLPKI